MLEELAADPGKARVLDAHTARILTTTALAALNALNRRELALAAKRGNGATPERRDRLVNIDEAAEKLGVKPDWLYRHPRLPFTVPQGRMLRFSELGIEEYIRNRRNSLNCTRATQRARRPSSLHAGLGFPHAQQTRAKCFCGSTAGGDCIYLFPQGGLWCLVVISKLRVSWQLPIQGLHL